jgi:glycine/D-amino acid oxidase-like deaminating enzyme
MADELADLVVVGAGAIGGWASYFAKAAGLGRVIVIDKGRAGNGASSRAAGMVRAQGGTKTTVALGRWSIDFYRRQRDELETDSGFRQLGYQILALTEPEERAGRERVAMQRQAGLPVDWLGSDEALRFNPYLDPRSFRGASYLATDGCIDPPRNVRAYSLAMHRAGVELREMTTFVGLQLDRTSGGARVTAVETDRGTISTARIILTGGPTLHEVGRAAGIRIPVGAVRHQVAMTEPDGAFEAPQAMGFDLGAGLYWRIEDGGLLFGMSNPAERPGIARSIDWPYLEAMRARLARFVPITEHLELCKAWAATIEYTPDHHPVLGPGLMADGSPIEGVTVASAGGHGMMWGPAVARIAADLALRGRTDVADIAELGLDRFDAEGRSTIASDPVALPFPTTTGAALAEATFGGGNAR